MLRKMSNAARSLVVTVVTLGTLAAHAGAAGQGAETAEPAPLLFDGRFLHAGSAAEERANDAAIERSVEDVNFVLRGATRRYLHRKSVPPETIVFRPQGQQLTLLWGQNRRWRGLPDGRSRLNRRHDKPDRWISVGIEGRTLTQVVREDSGTRTTSFTISEDGQRMEVRVRVTSDRLGEDLRLRFYFRREA